MKLNIAATFTLLALTVVGASPAADKNDDNPSGAALEAREDKCSIRVHYVSNWREAGYQRYRVEATAHKGEGKWEEDFMLYEWRRKFTNERDWHYAHLANPQVWMEGNKMIADISTFIGYNGWVQYRNLHQTAVNSWREWTGYTCDVDSKW